MGVSDFVHDEHVVVDMDEEYELPGGRRVRRRRSPIASEAVEGPHDYHPIKQVQLKNLTNEINNILRDHSMTFIEVLVEKENKKEMMKIMKNIEKNEWRENQDDLVKMKLNDLESSDHVA